MLVSKCNHTVPHNKFVVCHAQTSWFKLLHSNVTKSVLNGDSDSLQEGVKNKECYGLLLDSKYITDSSINRLGNNKTLEPMDLYWADTNT